MKRKHYVHSGEGNEGTWRRVYATDRGIKRILTRERCGGDRWARAYTLAMGAAFVGVDTETGEARDLSATGLIK